MGRELRRIPRNWEHARNERGDYMPLKDGLNLALREWEAEAVKWAEGIIPEKQKYPSMSFEEWYGEKPNPQDYMPDWPEAERTQWQMYETSTEGTPISPPMESAEALAHWLADNGACCFASMTATYEEWLIIIQAGSVPSVIITLRK